MGRKSGGQEVVGVILFGRKLCGREVVVTGCGGQEVWSGPVIVAVTVVAKDF